MTVPTRPTVRITTALALVLMCVALFWILDRSLSR